MKPHWRDNTLMRGGQELARLEPHFGLWRVRSRNATSSPTTRSIAARLAELATRFD
jgi:hypothetical protein